MIGRTLNHYEVLEKLGQGGMGVVYRARDIRLGRAVAIKVLRPEAVGDPERKWRFVREAKAASALNHPNIVTIYDIDAAEGVDFIAMEHVEGRPLDRVIEGHGLPLNETLDYAVQTASALAAAHEAGIVHRDIKPANILLTPAGRIKVLDFGLAKLVEPGTPDGSAPSATEVSASPTVTALPGTRQGVILGTLSYMSPEQAEGKPVDARSDVFSFGTVLYEMLAGRRPFEGESLLSTLTAILRDDPPPLKAARPDVPADLDRIVSRSLQKDRDDRYPSAAELWRDLVGVQSRLATPRVGLKSLLARPRFAVPAALLLLAAAGAASWLAVRSSRARWARETALPEISRLVEAEEPGAAFRLAKSAQRHAPKEFESVRRHSWFEISVRTEPPGADVFMKGYMPSDTEWLHAGRSPLQFWIPFANWRWRFEKEGFRTEEAAGGTRSDVTIRMDREGSALPGMVRIPGGRFQFRSADPVELSDYWIDKHEMTNKEFKAFVQAGGYRTREHWKQPFIKDGRTLSWEEAMAELRDSTGRAGPAVWELDTYPDGQADFPVGGVSWHEAAAYAAFAGKSLPTVYHWYNAAGMGSYSDILRLSNFGGTGPAPIGRHQGLGAYGTYDMAGNVKEWCWNASRDRRYILGGGWDEPKYFFQETDAQSPFRRMPGDGFRCVKYEVPLPENLTAPIEALSRDFRKERPASDEVFETYRNVYSYDPSELNAVVESLEDNSDHWKKEKIVFDAAYGNERVTAYLFLPKNATPPYQTALYFPGAYAFHIRSSADLGLEWWIQFLLRSGRAVMHPIYKGTYERGVPPGGPNQSRDLVIQWSKDLRRSIDYLETRKDIAREKLFYYGFSRGAAHGPILAALEERLKTAVLLNGGFYLRKQPPEIEAIHFAPRLRAPVLMVNGRDDFIFPLESAQTPMFRLLGAPERDKRHVLFEGGHVPPRIQDLIKEVLDWLDRYLGPVGTVPEASGSAG